MRLGFLILLVIGVGLVGCKETKSARFKACDNKEYEDISDYQDCQYPNPPIGRWHAVYSNEFARKHDLPLENVSTDLSPGVDYMEMDVQPHGNGGTACLVNMLVKKPHDIALYPSDHLPGLPKDRKLIHLLDLGHFKNKVKPIASFSAATRNYKIEKSGYETTTFAIYVEDVLPGYDYFGANANCKMMSMHPSVFPDQFAFWINKASVWGKYKMLHRRYEAPTTPKGEDFFNSHFFINIPSELITNIFKDVPVGGQ